MLALLLCSLLAVAAATPAAVTFDVTPRLTQEHEMLLQALTDAVTLMTSDNWVNVNDRVDDALSCINEILPE